MRISDWSSDVCSSDFAQRFSFAIAHRLKIVVGGDGGQGDWWRGAPLVPPLRPSCSASEPGIQGRPFRRLPWTLGFAPRVTVLVILIGCVLILGFWLNSYSARSWTPDRSAGGGCSRGGADRPEPRERR